MEDIFTFPINGTVIFCEKFKLMGDSDFGDWYRIGAELSHIEKNACLWIYDKISFGQSNEVSKSMALLRILKGI